jgi:hypothetical protein
MILYAGVEDIVTEAVFAEPENQIVKTLQNSTLSPKCGMSRYPSTRLQKPTSLVTI